MEGPEGSLDSLLSAPLRVVVEPAFFRWPLLLAGSTSTLERKVKHQGLLKCPDLGDDHGHVQGVSIEPSVFVWGVKMVEDKLGGESSGILELGVLWVAVEVGTGDLNAWQNKQLRVKSKFSKAIPGENFASLLIWNSSLLREHIRNGDSPFWSGASLTKPF